MNIDNIKVKRRSFSKHHELQKILELKRNDRFLVEFPEQFKIDGWCIMKINKPKFKNGKWKKIKIVFTDPIGPSTSKGLFEIIKFIEENKKTDILSIFKVSIKSESISCILDTVLFPAPPIPTTIDFIFKTLSKSERYLSSSKLAELLEFTF